MTRHKFDIKTQRKGKAVLEYFGFPGYSTADLKMTGFFGWGGMGL